MIPGQFTRYGRGGLGYALFLTLLFAALLGTALFVGFPADDPRAASIWLFLGLFPLVNALFDYVSYGLTITLIREGFRTKGMAILGWLIVDIAAALILFFALSLTLTCIVGWLNGAMTVPVFDLAGFFAAPGDHVWVAGMIFSTLVPTLVHLVLAAFSILTWVPPKVRNWIEAGIAAKSESGMQFLVSAIAVSLVNAAYALVISWGVLALLRAMWSVRGPVMVAYLDAVQWVARVVGAL